MRNRSPSENQLAVLKAIHAEGPISRSDLPKITGLAAGTVSRITSELVRRGFVTERKEDRRHSGRPRVLLEIAGEGPVAVGGSITIRDALLATFVDLSGRTRFEVEVEFATRETLGELALNIADAMSAAIEASGFAKEQIEHVGIGVPAIVDSARGVVHFMTTFEQKPVPFAELISERIGLPVTIERNITCLARAEHWHGPAQGFNSFSLIHIGLGVDSAMYVDGSPYVGAHGFGPELGHMKTCHDPDAAACYCGGKGCATVYASIYGIVRRSGLAVTLPERAFEIDVYERHFEQLLQQACAGDAKAIELFASAGTHLGRLVADLVNSADPGLVLIYVPDPRYVGLVEKTFHEALHANALARILSLSEVRFLEPEADWQSKGTAALALEKS